MLQKRICSVDSLAIAALAAMTLVFFASALLSPGMFTNGDIEAYYLPYWTYISDHLRQGHVPLWNPFIGLGVPLQADMETGLFYFPTAIFHLFPGYRTIIILVALHVLLSGVFTYLFATRCVRLSPLAATVAATAVMFSGYTASQVGHLNIVASGAWFTVVVYLCSKMLLAANRSLSLTYGLLAAVAFSLEILAQGSQVIYLSFIVLTILALCLTLPRRNWLGLFTAIPAIVAIALLLSAVQLLPTFELATQSVRSSGLSWDEATSSSVDPLYFLVSSVLPTFFFVSLDGVGSSPFAQTVGYTGILALVAAALGLSYGKRDRYFAFALSTLAISLFFATGKFNPLYRFFYDFLPGLDMLRVPGRWLFLTVYSLALLAGLGVNALSTGQVRCPAAMSFFGRVAAVIIAVVLGLFAVHLVVPQQSELYEQTNRLSPPLLALVTFSSSAMVLMYALARAEKRRAAYAGVAVVFVLFADLFLFSRYLPFNWPYQPRPLAAIATLKSDQTLFRVAKPSNWQSVSLMTERLYEVDAYTTGAIGRFGRFKQALPLNPEPLLDLINVKYLLVAPSRSLTASLPRDNVLTHSPPEGLRLVERLTFLPRAFAVHHARSVSGQDALDGMVKAGFDPRQVVFVEGGPEISHTSNGDNVQILEYLPETVRLRADLSEDGYVVLSDTYYPGWRAFVDGHESPIYRADYILKAIYLPRGSHDVVFQFDPPLYKVGLGISAAMGLAIACALALLFLRRTKPSSRSSSS